MYVKAEKKRKNISESDKVVTFREKLRWVWGGHSRDTLIYVCHLNLLQLNYIYVFYGINKYNYENQKIALHLYLYPRSFKTWAQGPNAQLLIVYLYMDITQNLHTQVSSKRTQYSSLKVFFPVFSFLGNESINQLPDHRNKECKSNFKHFFLSCCSTSNPCSGPVGFIFLIFLRPLQFFPPIIIILLLVIIHFYWLLLQNLDFSPWPQSCFSLSFFLRSVHKDLFFKVLLFFKKIFI